MTAPVATVVVPTYERPERLKRLVRALEAQDLDAPFEVVLVDNGSGPATAAVLQRLQAASPLDLRPLRIEENHGPAPARNLGWRAARSDLIAFTDDDCVPQPGWLRGLVAGAAGADIVQGATRAHPEQPAVGLFSWAPDTDASGRFETCNLAYARRVLEATGGFDEGYHERAGGAATWGDDTELGLRALALGFTEAAVPDAVVWHDVKPGRLRDRLADLPRRGGVVLLLKRHPVQRRALPSPWFAHPAHAWVTGGAAAAAASAVLTRHAAPRAVLVLAAAGWARERGRGQPRRAWPRILPQWLVVDVVETAVLARASLRYRTFYL